MKKEIADGLSRLIPKNTELLKKTHCFILDIKCVLFNAVKEFPVTIEEMKFKTKFDKFKLIKPKKNY